MKPAELLAFFDLTPKTKSLKGILKTTAPSVVFEFFDNYRWRLEITVGDKTIDRTTVELPSNVKFYVKQGTDLYLEYVPVKGAWRIFDESLREPRIQWTDTSSPIADQVLLRSLFVNDDDDNSVSVYDVLFKQLNSSNYSTLEKKTRFEAAQQTFQQWKTKRVGTGLPKPPIDATAARCLSAAIHGTAPMVRRTGINN
jgi:hypothetical protein